MVKPVRRFGAQGIKDGARKNNIPAREVRTGMRFSRTSDQKLNVKLKWP